MIQAIAKLLRANSLSRIDALSRQVAELSVEAVCLHVGEQVQSMSFSEARGYVRARAAAIVRRHARLAILRHPGGDLAWAETVARTAIERIVPSVLRKTGVGVPRAAVARLAA